MLPYSPYTPASASPPLSGRRTPSGGTGGFSGTLAGLVLSPGWYAPGSAPATGGMQTVGLQGAGTRYTLLRKFPAYTLIAVEWPCPLAQRDTGKNGD